MKTQASPSNLLCDGAKGDTVDVGMRVNVSQRRWVQRGASLPNEDFEGRRKLIRTGQSAANVTVKSNLIGGEGEKILERKL